MGSIVFVVVVGEARARLLCSRRTWTMMQHGDWMITLLW